MIRPSIGRLAALFSLAVLMSLAVPSTAGAQGFDPEAMHQRMAAQVDDTIKLLELEGETADTVRTILLQRVDKRMDLFTKMRQARQAGQQAGFAGMREAMTKIDDETEGQLAKVLPEEKVKAWKAHEEELRSRMRRGPRNG